MLCRFLDETEVRCLPPFLAQTLRHLTNFFAPTPWEFATKKLLMPGFGPGKTPNEIEGQVHNSCPILNYQPILRDFKFFDFSDIGNKNTNAQYTQTTYRLKKNTPLVGDS